MESDQKPTSTKIGKNKAGTQAVFKFGPVVVASVYKSMLFRGNETPFCIEFRLPGNFPHKDRHATMEDAIQEGKRVVSAWLETTNLSYTKIEEPIQASEKPE